MRTAQALVVDDGAGFRRDAVQPIDIQSTDRPGSNRILRPPGICCFRAFSFFGRLSHAVDRPLSLGFQRLFFIKLAQSLINVRKEILRARNFPDLVIPVDRRDFTVVSIEALRISGSIGVKLNKVAILEPFGMNVLLLTNRVHHLGHHRDTVITEDRAESIVNGIQACEVTRDLPTYFTRLELG